MSTATTTPPRPCRVNIDIAPIVCALVDGLITDGIHHKQLAMEEALRQLMPQVVCALIDGLITDGIHHKQWAMEEALRQLMPQEFEALMSAYRWEEGIAP